MNQSHVEWSRNLFNSLKDGGVWGIPRSGLLFTRRGNTLVLTSLLPHDTGMPITKGELEKQQADEFEVVKEHFAAAGITVLREEEVPSAEK